MKGFPRSEHAHLLGRIKRPLLPSPSCTDGFALIIALGLMSITLLTVLSLASLVRIQAGSEVHSIQEAQAKANAHLALMLALGQLHKNAGPDQRVTARGEILQDLSGDGTRHWTGVWDTRSMDDGPTWLITEIQGAQPDQQKTMTDPTETELNVDVPLRTVGGTTSDPTGTYAWWTSDENTKANVAARSELNGNNPNMIRKQIATAASFDRDINELAERHELQEWRMVIPDDPLFLEKIPRTLHPQQIPYLLGNGDPSQVAESQSLLQKRFHDYTVSSASALTNTWDGGLRLDLSHLRRLGPTASQADIDAAFEHPNFPNWPFLTPGLAEYLDFAPGNIGNIVTPQASESYYEDPLGFKIAPLITEFFFIGDFIVRSFVGGVSDEVILYYYIASELFNPYTQRMELDNGTGRFPDDPGDIRVRITGWPYVVIRNLTQGRVNVLEMPEVLSIVNSFNDHDSGFLRFNFSPTNNPRAQYNGINTQGGVWPMHVGHLGYDPDTWDEFEIEFVRDVSGLPEGAGLPSTEGEPLVIEFLEYFTNSDDPVLVQAFEIENWEGGDGGGNLTLNYPALSGDNSSRLVNGVSAMGRNSGNRRLNSEISTFGIHLRPVDEWNDNSFFHEQTQPLDFLFGLADLRQRSVRIDMSSPESGDGRFWESFPPAEVTTDERGRTDDFFYGIEFGSPVFSRNARLIDLPRGEVFSMGALNALQFDGFPFRPLGNVFIEEGDPDSATLTPSGALSEFAPSMASPDHFSLSQFYDRFFFSSLPIDPGAITDDQDLMNLPNGWIRRNPLVPLENGMLASAESSLQLMVAGGFNINSTSAPAWRAQLLNHLPFGVIETVNGSNLEANGDPWRSVSFAHNFHPLYESGDYAENQNFELFERFFKNNNSSSRNHHAFRQGFRELARDGSFDLTGELSEEIVAKILDWVEERGRPFASVAEFADSGILQAAINSIEGINSLNGRRIPTRAPAHVSAGDILGSLSPRLFARSDTFTIRFYGEHEGAEAMGEATVQRYPVDDSDGRTFVLKDFRWIQNPLN